MLIWIFLFLIIVAISLVLAIQSMADYQKKPRQLGTPYSLFLVTKLQNLDPEILNKLYRSVLPGSSVVSFERLFKGSKSALVIFGPKDRLEAFTQALGLLEIEDYSKKAFKEFLVWEVGLKSRGQDRKLLEDIFMNLPDLGDEEEFWWQLVLQPSKGKKDDSEVNFQAVIRAVALSENKQRTQELQKEYLKIGRDQGLALFPQAYSTPQLLKLYQERALPSGGIFSSIQILSLLGLKTKDVSGD